MAVKNGMIRFATKGFRVQRLNPDGTIARPSRAVGFAGRADLRQFTQNGLAKLTIKVGSHQEQTRDVDFSGVEDIVNVTPQEAAVAINASGFTDSIASVEPSSGRLLVGATGLVPSRIGIVLNRLQNVSQALTVTLDANERFIVDYVLEGLRYQSEPGASVVFDANAAYSNTVWLTETRNNPVIHPMQLMGSWIGWSSTIQFFFNNRDRIPGYNFARLRDFEPASSLPGTDGIMQVTGPLASVLDFGGGRAHGGDLRCLSFFNDTAMSITLPKDIIEREEIDIEGANGSPTRMVIGARMQGKSPVITMKEKNYDFLQLVQGGVLNRTLGTYDPPMPNESDHPSFMIEIYSPLYGQGPNKQSDMKGYEKILLRNCMGWEGDVPIEAKTWAQYAININAVGYTNEVGRNFPAWQEQQLSIEAFSELNVMAVSMDEVTLGNQLEVPMDSLTGAIAAQAPSGVTPTAAQARMEKVDSSSSDCDTLGALD